MGKQSTRYRTWHRQAIVRLGEATELVDATTRLTKALTRLVAVLSILLLLLRS